METPICMSCKKEVMDLKDDQLYMRFSGKEDHENVVYELNLNFLNDIIADQSEITLREEIENKKYYWHKYYFFELKKQKT